MSLLHEAARDALDAIPNLDVLPTGKERDRLFAAFQRLTLLATRALDENTAHRKPDRSALLRMAGNIAGGARGVRPNGWSARFGTFRH